jgi:hypothetical protein
MAFLTVFLVSLTLFAVFWGGSQFAQGFLYNQPAGRLPVRAAAAAVLVGGYMGLWVWIDKNNPGRYDTLFQFEPYSVKDVNEFEAVRWKAAAGKLVKGEDGKPVEETVKYKRVPGGGGRTGEFTREGVIPPEPFRLNDARMMTAAIVATPDEGGSPVRFDADLKTSGAGMPEYAKDRKFVDAPTGRYVKAEQPGTVFVPSTKTVVVAVLLNAGVFVVWFLAAWLAMRFSWAHALGIAAGFGLVTMLIAMPLLFKPNRAPKTQAAPAAAERSESNGQRSAA